MPRRKPTAAGWRISPRASAASFRLKAEATSIVAEATRIVLETRESPMTNRLSRALSILAAAVLLLAGAQAPPQDLEHPPVGILEGNALERLKLTRADLRTAEANPSIRYNGITRFLDRTRTVVTGTLDDSTVADAEGDRRHGHLRRQGHNRREHRRAPSSGSSGRGCAPRSPTATRSARTRGVISASGPTPRRSAARRTAGTRSRARATTSSRRPTSGTSGPGSIPAGTAPATSSSIGD